MAHKPSPNSLIHCAKCGEDYSATYKRCPFCNAKNEPQQADSDRSESSSDLEDSYVFDGQDVFDNDEGDDSAPASSKGGKRLADKPLSIPFANADINWPRMITFVCSLVIIVAAMIIVFTVIYPQLKNPTADSSQSPSSAVTDSGSGATQGVDPSAAVSGPDASSPVTDPVASVPPSASAGLTALTFSRANDADFTLAPGESHTIVLNFSPASWSGYVTWTSTDTTVATVDDNGKVTNVNTSGSLRSAVITATAGGRTLESKVYCKSAVSGPAASDSPASDPPATQSPSGSGAVTVGKRGTIVNAGGGLNVRSGPGTSNEKIGSLFNGDSITVLADAGGGWYKISYSGVGGVATEGYIMGTYISTN